MDDPRYPIGKFESKSAYTLQDAEFYLDELNAHPAMMRVFCSHLDDNELELSYREGGWTIKQVIHHLADSHMNGYMRIKLALTEDNPIIKPYDQDKWANSPDVKATDHNLSLDILEGVHNRLVNLFIYPITQDQIFRTYHHPESNTDISVVQALHLYAWHGQHHLEHIKIALDQI